VGIDAMTYITLDEASTQLSKLIQDAARGEQIILTQDSTPVAEIVPVTISRGPRQPGSAKDLITYMADDFDAPLADFQEYS
jgi:prevent-host-death family protein